MQTWALSVVFLFLTVFGLQAQENTLDYFLEKGKENTPVFKENLNLQKIGELQGQVILAQNNAWQFYASSEILISPYFNNNGKVIDISTTPSPNAIGYDVGITNGGLYAAQLNLTKNLFNKSMVDNLLFQNRVANYSLVLGYEEQSRVLVRNITEAYISCYQSQLQEKFLNELISDLNKRLDVVEILAKRGILSESDFLQLQIDLQTRILELEQTHSNTEAFYTQLLNLSGTQAAEFLPLTQPELFVGEEKEHFLFEKKYQNDSLLLIADQLVFENRYKPQLAAYGNTGLNAVDLPNIEKRFGLSAGLRLVIPIYDGKQRELNALQNEIKTENLEAYKTFARTTINNSIQSLNRQIADLQSSLTEMDKQLDRQKQLLELFKGKLVQGQVSVIDYLNIIQNYRLMTYTKLQAQTNLWLLYTQYNFINR